MAIQLSPTTQTTTKERRVMAFQVNTPPNTNPSVDVSYGEVLYGTTGEILTYNPNIANLKLTAAQLTALLPTGNAYNLPAFPALYVGLRNFLDQQFLDNFSGKFPD